MVSSFRKENPQKYSGQYDTIKLLITAISVIAKVFYHLGHHFVCFWKPMHV